MTGQLTIDRCAVCGRPDGYRGWQILRLRLSDGKGLVFIHDAHGLDTVAAVGYRLSIQMATRDTS